jgi:hypothetical protein
MKLCDTPMVTRMLRLAIPEKLTHIHRWAAAMRERPAAKVAV